MSPPSKQALWSVLSLDLSEPQRTAWLMVDALCTSVEGVVKGPSKTSGPWSAGAGVQQAVCVRATWRRPLGRGEVREVAMAQIQMSCLQV